MGRGTVTAAGIGPRGLKWLSTEPKNGKLLRWVLARREIGLFHVAQLLDVVARREFPVVLEKLDEGPRFIALMQLLDDAPAQGRVVVAELGQFFLRT